MSSVSFKSTSTEEKMSMYENMVEELVADENSRYILDGKLLLHVIYVFSLRNGVYMILLRHRNRF